MKDYTELVKALRCGNDGKLPCHNNECPYWVDQWHGIGLCNVIIKDEDAAAAIEALQAQLSKRGEIVRCGECKHRTELTTTKWHPCVDVPVNDDWYCADGERKVQE